MSSQHQRAWVRQPSSRRLDLINPDPNAWEDEDLAIGLSRTYRWGGHSIWELPMSVAQHSLLVLALREQASSDPLDRLTALRELMHDAEEGLIGFDPISPLKPILGERFAHLFERLTDAIFTRYQLCAWTVDEKRLHKQADQLAAASEAVHVAGWHPEEVKNTLGITVESLQDDPLVAIYGGKPWEPWPSRIAADRFLTALKQLSVNVQQAA
jgi:5'-deoxynucleotidase YfbR-like HD superfamily hydrolase